MISWIFIGLVMTILLTPGPTNTLLASSGVQVGVRKSLKLIPAEAMGYFIAIGAWGMLIGFISKTLPLLPVIIKLASATYIVFLAIKLWKTAKQDLNMDQPTIGARELFCATLLNPKALLFASAIFPASAWTSLKLYMMHILTFEALIMPIALCWILLGTVLTSNKVQWLNACNLQRTASLVLMTFSVPMSYSAILSLQ
ncbi:MAG: LysE family transporter [Acinetobacter sp.]